MVVSFLHKELEWKVKKLKHKKLVSCNRGSRINLNFQHVNKPSRIGPNKVLQSWLIYTVCKLLVGIYKGDGGLKEMGAY